MKISYRKIYDTVARIPEGQVATYGQVATLAGYPNHARQVGYALAALTDDNEAVPWQRVINAKGEISPRRNSDGDLIQRLLLEEEGVVFNGQGRIALKVFQWGKGLEGS
jgi:methylated-DNA-protein-cysteine methyltransferase related protein